MAAAQLQASTMTRASTSMCKERGECVSVVLMGPPGAGKGTQAGTVARLVNAAHVASGDMFREIIKTDTEQARLIKSYMDHGELVPDSLTLDMVMARLDQDDASKGFILDGFPRTVSQARALEARLAATNRRIDCVINLAVPRDVLLARLSGRWLCRKCHSSYHLLFSPPQVQGVCDRCGGELYQRTDDTLETARRRLEVYEYATQPVLQYYRNRGLLVDVRGDQSVEEVTDALREAVLTKRETL